MQDLRNFRQALFENPQRRRIGDHQRRNVFRHQFAQSFDVHLSVRFGLDVFDFVARNNGGGWICAVRGIGNQHFLARAALLLQVCANQKQSGELSLRACGRLQRNGVHPGNFEQAFFQQAQDFQAALREFLRLIGMLRRDSFEPRYEFIHARVVLHGAGAERIHAKIDGVIPGGKPREVAQHFDFAHFGEAFDAFLAMMCAKRFGWFRGRHIQWRQFERALSRRRFLEDQSFVLIYVPRHFSDCFVHIFLNRLFQRPLHRAGKSLNLRAGRCFRHAYERAFGQLRIRRTQR